MNAKLILDGVRRETSIRIPMREDGSWYTKSKSSKRTQPICILWHYSVCICSHRFAQ
jgi:hypothetical protein